MTETTYTIDNDRENRKRITSIVRANRYSDIKTIRTHVRSACKAGWMSFEPKVRRYYLQYIAREKERTTGAEPEALCPACDCKHTTYLITDTACPSCGVLCETTGTYVQETDTLTSSVYSPSGLRTIRHCKTVPPQHCTECSVGLLRDDIVTIKSSPYCPKCAEGKTFTCTNCNTLQHTDDKHPEKGCKTCFTKWVETTTPISVYGFVPDTGWVVHRLPTDKPGARIGGIELEVENTQAYPSPELTAVQVREVMPYVLTSHDSSLKGRYKGFEIRTHPATLSYHKEQWAKFFASLSRWKLRSFDGGNCGLHIHISLQGITDYARVRMNALVNDERNRGFLTRLCGRDANGYATYNNDAGKLRRLTKQGRKTGHYCILSWGDDTVEFRGPRGTLLPRRFWTCVEFAYSLPEYCGELRSVTQFGLENYKQWVSKTTYPNLYGFINSPEGKDSL